MKRQIAWGLSFIILFIGAFCSVAQAQDPAAPAPPRHLDGWGMVVDPDGNSTFRSEKGQLTIIAPGPVHDMSIELGRINAPRTAWKVEGDFIAQVKVDGRFDPGTEQGLPVRLPYHGAGLLLMHDLNNYLRLDRAALTKRTGQQHQVVLQSWTSGKPATLAPSSGLVLKAPASVYLRLERRGNQVLGAVALQPGKWHYFEARNVPLPKALWIGVSTVNVSGNPLETHFEQFQILQPAKLELPAEGDPPSDLPPGPDGQKPPKPIGDFPVAVLASIAK